MIVLASENAVLAYLILAPQLDDFASAFHPFGQSENLEWSPTEAMNIDLRNGLLTGAPSDPCHYSVENLQTAMKTKL